MTLAETIELLRKLEKAATPGPWVHEKHPSDGGGEYTTGHVISVHHTYRGNLVSRPDSVTGADSMTYADGELITAMRNALPELLEHAGDWRAKFERAQRRWGLLKQRILHEIDALGHPRLSTPQKRHAAANSIARLNWVLAEMRKSPDVLAEAVPPEPLPWTDLQLEHALQVAMDYGFNAFKQVLLDSRRKS